MQTCLYSSDPAKSLPVAFCRTPNRNGCFSVFPLEGLHYRICMSVSIPPGTVLLIFSSFSVLCNKGDNVWQKEEWSQHVRLGKHHRVKLSSLSLIILNVFYASTHLNKLEKTALSKPNWYPHDSGMPTLIGNLIVSTCLQLTALSNKWQVNGKRNVLLLLKSSKCKIPPSSNSDNCYVNVKAWKREGQYKGFTLYFLLDAKMFVPDFLWIIMD